MNLAQAKNIKVAVDKFFAEPDAEKFLEGVCHFRKPLVDGEGRLDPIAEGRRQVFLTLKTISELEPDQVVALYKEKGE